MIHQVLARLAGVITIPVTLCMPTAMGANNAAAASTYVTLDADYPAGEIFQVQVQASDRLWVDGRVPAAFKPYTEQDRGRVNVWFAGMDGKYRIFESRGSLMVSRSEVGRQDSRLLPVRGRAEFDALGYPKRGPSDPTELIPIFPGRPVAAGDTWAATAEVSEALGNGPAIYAYRVEKIETGPADGSQAVITFEVHARLAPPATLPGWSSSINGQGTLVWDCHAHQRTAKQFHIVYAARSPDGKSRILEELTDREIVTRAAREFSGGHSL